MDRKTRAVKNFERPYLELRKYIGYLGMAIPIVVWLGAWILPPHVRIQGSISAYYHTEMRNVFVGILFATGIFLLTYNPASYDSSYRDEPDRIAAIAAGIFAIGVAIFPTSRSNWEAIQPPAVYPEGLYGWIHLTFAALFFLTLIYFSYSLFTKTKPGTEIKRGSKKALRNKTYKTCAGIIAVCLLLMAAYTIYSSSLPEGAPNLIESYNPVFFLEWIALWAFGLSWSIKGEAEALSIFHD